MLKVNEQVSHCATTSGVSLSRHLAPQLKTVAHCFNAALCISYGTITVGGVLSLSNILTEDKT